MLNFLNKTNKSQGGSMPLLAIGAILAVASIAISIYNFSNFAPKAIVEVETPKIRAEQKPPTSIKQTKTSFGAVNGLTKNLLSLNSEIAAKSLTKEESDLKLANLTGVAKQRKVLIKELMRENPMAFLATALRKNQRSLLPQNIQKDIEQETTLTAKIEVLHIDDFKNPENSRFEYFLRTKDAKLNFYPTNELYLVSGAEVKVSGFQLDEIVVSDTNKQNFQVTKEAPPLESVGDQKTLVLLINFLDSPAIPFTKEQAYDIIFNGQFQKFYKEQSYNQVSFSGDVYGWFALPRERGFSDITHIEFKKIIIENTINLENYDRLVYLYNRDFSSGYSSIGKWDISVDGINVYRLSQSSVFVGFYDQPSFWGVQPFKWTNFDFMASHELGHGLGVMHANGWDCDSQILYGENCQHLEYGNYFDTMGRAGNSLHFNAFYKESLGWINSSNSLFINETSTYTINPLELDGGKSLAKIQVKNTTSTSFYLEYRQGIGFDANLNNTNLFSNQSGLFVNKIIKDYNFPHLLDMSPTSLPWSEDSQQITLNGQNVFANHNTGITIGPIINTSTSSITFDVEVKEPTCIFQKPSFSVVHGDLDYLGVHVGGSAYIGLRIFNSDYYPCGLSEFDVIPVFPSDWQYETYPPGNVSIFSSEIGGKGFQFIVPSGTVPGDYLTKFEVVNLRSGLKTNKEFVIKVTPPLIISDIKPILGPVGAEITLSGSGFGAFNINNSDGVLFYNLNGYGSSVYLANIPSDNETTLKFHVPAIINLNNCNEQCATPTPAGIYHIMVSDNSSYSNTVNFEVIEPKPLSPLSITNPKNNDTVATKSKVNIAADVSSEIKNKTERVEFYVDGKRKCQDKTAPYSCNWTVPKKSSQTYELQVKAFGNKKQFGVKPIAESEIIKVKAEKGTNAKNNISTTKDDVSTADISIEE